MNKLTLGYIRVSTDRQDISIDAQTNRVKQALAYHFAGQTLSLFAEPDTSGRIEFARRPEAAELLERAREARAAGVNVTVIIPKVDRLAATPLTSIRPCAGSTKWACASSFWTSNADTRFRQREN